jgi:hypothetical protein
MLAVYARQAMESGHFRTSQLKQLIFELGAARNELSFATPRACGYNPKILADDGNLSREGI